MTVERCAKILRETVHYYILAYSVVDGPVMVTSDRAKARVWPDERTGAR